MDALTLLKQDHRTVEELFTKFEALTDRALKQRKTIAERIVRELSIHSVIEEQLLYPTIRQKSDELNALVLEALEEHHVAKWLLNEIDGLPGDAERFAAKVKVLIENVRTHVKEEERELFPLVRKAMSREELMELGENLAQLKKAAPTRPHPRAPDQPPGNLIAGAVAKVMDTGRDLLSGRRVRPQEMAARQGRVAKSNKKRK